MKIQTDTTPEASRQASGYRTYSWLPLQHLNDGAHNPALGPAVQRSSDRELAAKGYQRVDTGKPDFLIGWHVSIEERTEADAFNPYYGYSWDPTFFGAPYYGAAVGGAGQQAVVREYRQGTLLLDVVDAASNQLIWRGSAEAEIAASMSDREKQVDEAVEKILDRFPPK